MAKLDKEFKVLRHVLEKKGLTASLEDRARKRSELLLNIKTGHGELAALLNKINSTYLYDDLCYRFYSHHSRSRYPGSRS